MCQFGDRSEPLLLLQTLGAVLEQIVLHVLTLGQNLRGDVVPIPAKGVVSIVQPVVDEL